MDPHILSLTEENYLKAIYTLSEQSPDSSTSTNEVAQLIQFKPGTVTETIKRLSEKGLIAYEKYQPLKLTIIGEESGPSDHPKTKTLENIPGPQNEFWLGGNRGNGRTVGTHPLREIGG
jgi:Mn-dependent DtxR family transcriptional regulator